MNKKVSIIIPAYNVESYIHRALESSLNQTYNNIEVIVVDDGSSDDTWTVITKYNYDKRLKFIHQENKGVSSARNMAISHITGDYCLFLDSDDWLELSAVEKLICLYNLHPDKLICVDRYFASYKDNQIIREQQNKYADNQEHDTNRSIEDIYYKRYNLQSSCYKLFRTDLIKKYNLLFDTNIFHGEDGLFVFNYILHTNGLYYNNIPLWNILDRPGSATNSNFNEKWYTAIDAANIMYENPNLSNEQKEMMRLYLVDRIQMVKNQAINSKAPKKVIRKITEQMRLHLKFYLTSSIPIRKKIFCISLFLPSWFIRNVMNKIISWL